MDVVNPAHASPDFLRLATAEQWFEAVRAAGPPGILVVIERWLGAALRSRTTAEDVWQETLLLAWSSRDQVVWQGVRAFRRWLLTVAQHRITRLAEESRTQKRGATVTEVPDRDFEERPQYAGPVRTTTPSQAARDREAAEVMQSVLADLPDDVREVVALRLFEDLTIEDVAARLGLGESATRHRLRRGLHLYRSRLSAKLGHGLWKSKDP